MLLGHRLHRVNVGQLFPIYSSALCRFLGAGSTLDLGSNLRSVGCSLDPNTAGAQGPSPGGCLVAWPLLCSHQGLGAQSCSFLEPGRAWWKARRGEVSPGPARGQWWTLPLHLPLGGHAVRQPLSEGQAQGWGDPWPARLCGEVEKAGV